MPEFKSLAELENYLNGKIRNAMENEVYHEVVVTMQEHVVEDVYDRYQPTQYVRTGELAQESNMQKTMIGDNTLEVENIRADEESGRLVAPVIESGQGYEWQHSEIYKRQPNPRPFMENTAQDLASGKAQTALAEGLKRQGLNVE